MKRDNVIFSSLLRQHEKLGILKPVNGKICICKKDKRKTLIHLKIFLFQWVVTVMKQGSF